MNININFEANDWLTILEKLNNKLLSSMSHEFNPNELTASTECGIELPLDLMTFQGRVGAVPRLLGGGGWAT